VVPDRTTVCLRLEDDLDGDAYARSVQLRSGLGPEAVPPPGSRCGRGLSSPLQLCPQLHQWSRG